MNPLETIRLIDSYTRSIDDLRRDMADAYVQLGAELRELRQSMLLTPSQAAQVACQADMTVMMMERGSIVSLDEVRNYVAALEAYRNER